MQWKKVVSNAVGPTDDVLEDKVVLAWNGKKWTATRTVVTRTTTTTTTVTEAGPFESHDGAVKQLRGVLPAGHALYTRGDDRDRSEAEAKAE